MTINPLQTLTVLRHTHLMILWLAKIFSAVGDRLHEIAIVWLSVQLIGSEAGFVLAAGATARLLFGLLGGVYADRWNHQKTMIGADLGRAIAVLTIPAAWWLGGWAKSV